MVPGKLLLLVEDEMLIAHTLEVALLEAGFELRTVHDGVSALRALEENPEQFSALLTDIRLPKDGPDGFDLAHRARELSVTIAVVYMSGDSAIDWASKGVPKSIMLQKPFAIAQLVTAVANLLNELPI
jgi:two-component system cell cycle response regulator CpdR